MRTAHLLPVLFLTALLTGCGSGPTIAVPHTQQMEGRVTGGQQPVSGASVQLYAAGTTGDGSPATALLAQPVVTDAAGSFSITGLYKCPPAGGLTYIVATGGNPGLGTGANPNLALIAALGPCGALAPATFIEINEVTTVAATSALAPFANSLTSIGSSAADVSSLQSAFTLAATLANTSTGTSPGLTVPPGYTVPVAEIYTLADILSACINSAGGAAGDTSTCGKLFTYTTPNSPAGLPAPTNTVAALLSLAGNPVLNTPSLYALLSPTAPFQPTLPAPPPSFAVALVAGPTTLQFSPASITFPATTATYTSAIQTATLTNTGADPAVIGSIALAGTNAADFTQVSNCASPLAAGASCTFQFTVTPAATGTRSASLVVTSNASGGTTSLPLSVTSGNPSAGPVTLSATSLTYYFAGSYQDVTLSNYGATPLNIKSFVETDNASSAPFFSTVFTVLPGTCIGILPPQSLCTFSVKSTGINAQLPSNLFEQQYSGMVTIVDDAAAGSQTVSLFSDNTLGSSAPVFGSTPVGTPVTASSSVAGADHNAAAYFSGTVSGTNAGDFSPSPAGCQGSGGTPFNTICSYSMTFTPSAAGTRTAYLSTTSGYLLLSGIGTSATTASFTAPSALTITAYISPVSSIATGSGTLSIVNTGNTVLNFPVPAIFTANPALFSVSGSCNALAPSATCSFVIGFSGSFSAATTASASLVLKETTTSQSQTVSITGSAVFSRPAVSPSSFTFPSQAYGTTSAPQLFTVSDVDGNPLGHALTITAASATNFAVSPSSCPASTTALCSFQGTFSPTSASTFYGQYLVTDTVTGFSTSVSAVGTGTTPPVTGSPAVTFSPTSITFATRPVNSTSIASMVTVTNSGTGNAPLAIAGISVSGAVNSNFSQANNCPASLATGASCTISVTFAPTATGTQSASVQVVCNAASSPNSVLLTGTAQ